MMADQDGRAFAQVDVFATEAFRGNPVAVVLEGDGLSSEQMARFAMWTNLSETTFIQTPTTEAADYRLRIFTPSSELPFAGHPTLGSARAWLDAGGVPSAPGRIVQECGAGLVEIRVDDDGGLAFAAPPTIRSGPVDDADLDRIVRALRIEPADVVASRWVDNGPGWVAIELASAAEVLALDPDFGDAPDLMLGVVGRYPDGDPSDFEVRAFAVGVGVTEDPVTGSLNASIAQWLIGEGRAPSAYRAAQGSRVGRAGRVDVSSDEDGAVWVGGATAVLIRGRVVV